jgi:hypothetical protein
MFDQKNEASRFHTKLKDTNREFSCKRKCNVPERSEDEGIESSDEKAISMIFGTSLS